MLCPHIQLTQFPQIKSLHLKRLCSLFTYCHSFRHFCNHQITIGFTIRSPEISYIEYTRILFPVYQYVINLAGSLPIRRGSSALMNVSVQEYHALNKHFLMWQNLLFKHYYHYYPDVYSHSQLSV
jgi:hypothetical protein